MHARVVARLVAVGAAFLVVACSGGSNGNGREEAGSAATGEPEVTVAELTPRSQISVSTGDLPRSSVSTGDGPASSATQQRISSLLSDLETRPSTTGTSGTSIVLPEAILFDFDEATLRPESAEVLARIAEVVELSGDQHVEIEGHADARGSEEYNQDLSKRRAAAVRDALVDEHGIASELLEARGFGETRPVAPNENPDGSDNPEGRQQNRRVEVIVDGIEP